MIDFGWRTKEYCGIGDDDIVFKRTRWGWSEPERIQHSGGQLTTATARRQTNREDVRGQLHEYLKELHLATIRERFEQAARQATQES